MRISCGSWRVPDEHLLEMIVCWRESFQWSCRVESLGMDLPERLFYDPSDLILDMLGVPPDSSEYCRDLLRGYLIRFRGTTVGEMHGLFSQIRSSVMRSPVGSLSNNE